MSHSPLIFIDTNTYLDLYSLKERHKLVDQLRSHRKYLFITKQISDEVFRNAYTRVQAVLQVDKFLGSIVPVHFFEDLEPRRVEPIQQAMKGFNELRKQVSDAIEDTIDLIIQSKDKLSQSLLELFRDAVAHSPEQFERGKDRMERGNPPGKSKDHLGDQISWEQLLDNVASVSDLWIITKDRDFYARDERKYLRTLLNLELKRLNPQITVRCFRSIVEGIDDFTKTIAKQSAFSAAEVEEIKDEQESLPVFDIPTAGTFPSWVQFPWTPTSHILPGGRMITYTWSNPGSPIVLAESKKKDSDKKP